MENMLHLTPSRGLLPDEFIFSPDQLPPAISAAGVSLPVVDMSRSRDEVRRAILDAGKEFGFFMVVNHGVSEEAMRDMEAVCQEFFQLPAADKAHLFSEDPSKATRIFSGSIFETGGENYWRDCLRLACAFPVSDSSKDWPDKPQRLREVVEKFIVLTRGMGMEILRLLCEGMGLRPDYLEGDISGGDVVLHINHYPPCPNPETTLGLPPHCDRNLLTLLLPSLVPGLEVAYNGDWIKVVPVPNSFVVNFGLQLEVVTNGMLKSIEHRVTTNMAVARTTVATCIMPAADCLIGPAEEFLSEDNPPLYRTLTFRDFKRIYNVVKLGSSLNLTTNLKNVQKEI
ncbi:2'-deoxymugineic-acid 2'-dioxygenase-like isoform X1 [Phragmites australis]|uniref:2'-deoxymugineic-acid 2'-dioxygenase-like isoform X1 n=1 Tax=Phragmites australis TaxID=29695 RepID=UPI002D765633|nr:2'-deoxymugineic-acid 2'-dioxygenase-like isoform X1 [Phragmites australis]